MPSLLMARVIAAPDDIVAQLAYIRDGARGRAERDSDPARQPDRSRRTDAGFATAEPAMPRVHNDAVLTAHTNSPLHAAE